MHEAWRRGGFESAVDSNPRETLNLNKALAIPAAHPLREQPDSSGMALVVEKAAVTMVVLMLRHLCLSVKESPVSRDSGSDAAAPFGF